MVDLMRKMPEKKRKQTTESPGKEKQKEKEKETSASSFDTKEKGGEKEKDEERACYCCGKTTCLLPKCPDKKTKPKSDWHKPQYFKESYSQHVVVKETRSETVVSFFYGMQCHSIKKVETEVILESGSTISLDKDESLLTNIPKCEDSILLQTNVGTKDVNQ